MYTEYMDCIRNILAFFQQSYSIYSRMAIDSMAVPINWGGGGGGVLGGGLKNIDM